MKRKVKVKPVAENEEQDKWERPGEEQKSAETEQEQKSVEGEGEG